MPSSQLFSKRRKYKICGNFSHSLDVVIGPFKDLNRVSVQVVSSISVCQEIYAPKFWSEDIHPVKFEINTSLLVTNKHHTICHRLQGQAFSEMYAQSLQHIRNSGKIKDDLFRSL